MFTTGRQYTEHPVTHTIFTAATAVLTPWSTVLLEKQTNSQLVKKFLTYYGIQMFIITFTRACHLVSIASQINRCPPPQHPTSWRHILVLSSHLCIGLPSGLNSSSLPPKAYMHLSSPPYMLYALPSQKHVARQQSRVVTSCWGAMVNILPLSCTILCDILALTNLKYVKIKSLAGI
jgi:hypothetical protein